MSRRYRLSEAWLRRSLRSIPLGSQTYSKSFTQYPLGSSPYFVTHAKGSQIWDVDGHRYTDFVNGLAAVSLGYNHPAVTRAVQTQLMKGTIFSLSHPLEVQVAERLINMVPCAEQVRFGKNGSDATAGAIRLARAYTGRDHVAVCGYHGWQDWYIGSTSRNKGVPRSVAALAHPFKYNDLASLEAIFRRWPNRVAAVILEPMNTAYPQNHFLENVRDLTHRHKAVLIFDEMITGFRFAEGGAQEYFHVTPDLATFGKAVANGFPLSVIAGKGSIMRLMEEIFFSFTFGGETLSLAAALATLTELQRRPVIAHLRTQGEKVLQGVQSRIQRHGLADVVTVSGHPSWSFLNFKPANGYTDWQIKTFFLQETLARGILTLGTHNMSFSHSNADIDHLLRVYDVVLPLIRKALDQKSLKRQLHCEALKPLFKLR